MCIHIWVYVVEELAGHDCICTPTDALFDAVVRTPFSAYKLMCGIGITESMITLHDDVPVLVTLLQYFTSWTGTEKHMNVSNQRL